MKILAPPDEAESYIISFLESRSHSLYAVSWAPTRTRTFFTPFFGNPGKFRALFWPGSLKVIFDRRSRCPTAKSLSCIYIRDFGNVVSSTEYNYVIVALSLE